MDKNEHYKVSFRPVVRTILYEDGEGAIIFAFDVDAAKGSRKLYLERGTVNSCKPENERRTLAAERVREYLQTCGYDVEYFDG